ncbi:hypothetical protein TH468_09940 [Thalassospira sp. MCCC 1A03138]|nr:hypothetical protein TH468_09940 [Thalassospira sp. MCCC 1A03138]
MGFIDVSDFTSRVQNAIVGTEIRPVWCARADKALIGTGAGPPASIYRGMDVSGLNAKGLMA